MSEINENGLTIDEQVEFDTLTSLPIKLLTEEQGPRLAELYNKIQDHQAVQGINSALAAILDEHRLRYSC